eukprot:3982705-Prymnesium_polylepis.1
MAREASEQGVLERLAIRPMASDDGTLSWVSERMLGRWSAVSPPSLFLMGPRGEPEPPPPDAVEPPTRTPCEVATALIEGGWGEVARMATAALRHAIAQLQQSVPRALAPMQRCVGDASERLSGGGAHVAAAAARCAAA